MGKIKIVTDSTADFSKENAAELGITVVPLSIIFEGNTYKDNIDFTPAEYIEKMKQLKELPTSSQPVVGEVVTVFEELKEEGADILCITLSDKLSGTYQSAVMAGEIAEANVTVFNSDNVSLPLQFQVREAARMAAEGKTIQEILDRLTVIRDNTKILIALNQLDNLVKSGRLSKGKAMISSVLNIKPILTLEAGSIVPVDKVRSFGQAIKYLLNDFNKGVEGKTVKYAGVIHVGALENAQTIIEGIKETSPECEPLLVHASQVLTTHVGEGVIAIAYFAE